MCLVNTSYAVKKMNIPENIDGAKVLLYTTIDDRHQATENCKQIIDNKEMRKAEWASICQYENDDGYYLFYGYSQNQMSDTYHSSLDEAKDQAEFEYLGVSNTWLEAAT